METTPAVKFRISVVLPAMLGYKTVRAALHAWEAQTCRDQLEILVLCPDAEHTGPLPPGQVAIPTGSLLLHQARALAIRRATADYVMLAEDHCLPDPSWAQAILKRIAEGWDAVGPALRSGNPATMWSQSSFLLGYGQWMRPVRGGPASVLPGHNAVVRRKALLELGPALEENLLVAAFLLQRLRKQRSRFYLEAEAGMRHFDPPRWKESLRVFWYVGFGFGAMRTRRWPWIARALYWLGTPLTAARHWARAVTQYMRAGRQAGLNPLCLVVAALSASVWACGEAIGALKGPARVASSQWISEIKPLVPTHA